MSRLLLCAFLLVVAQPAIAHAFLDNALPPVGSTITVPPKELKLAFTMELDLGSCSIDLQDQAGKSIALGALAFAPGNNTLLVVPIQAALHAGVYRVLWRVTAEDGHRTSGDYKFTLKSSP